nr:hypothetical protein [Tanacetum cinerariifolium]
MESLRKSILERAKHKQEKDRRVNDRVMQLKEKKDNSSKTLDAGLVVTKSNETESERHVLSSRSGNDTHTDDADINFVNDKQPMAEVQLFAEHNILTNEQQHSEQSGSVYDTYLLEKLLELMLLKRSKENTKCVSAASEELTAAKHKVGKGFSGVETSLFENMLEVRAVDSQDEVQIPAQDDDVQETVTEQVAADVSTSHIADDVAQPTSPLPPSHVISSTPITQVKGLETANVAQQLEILKLNARVKKLERLNKVKSSKLRRLKKVGTSQHVDSSEDVENVFNQGRKSVDMETNERIELEVEGRQADTQAEIYNVDLDHSSKVLSMQEDTEVQEAIEVMTTAKLITEIVTAAATQPKVLKIAAVAPAVSTRKRKGVVIRDPEEELHTETSAETPTVLKIAAAAPAVSTRKRKGVVIRDPGEELHTETSAETPTGLTYDDILPIFQARFDANLKFLFKSREEMEKEDEEIIKSINETPTQKVAKRKRLREQAKEDEDLKKQLEVVVDEDDDVFIEATPIGRKVPVLNYEIMMINNKPREDLEDLWKIIKADGQDALWRNQQTVYGQALLVNVAKLKVDEESEMSLELLRFTRQQLLESQQG